MNKYDHNQIEKKWQERWEQDKLYQTPASPKKKKYILDMFPYPSGDGLHVGHPEGYTATDILTRFYRMQGFDVLHPMGWDAFGLPAENYAIKQGIHPHETTQKNITRFREQIKSLGLSYDWDRELDTSNPDYYKWTQWLFLQLYKKGLAYKKEANVNWCPKDQTVLANEQVIDGCCDRCGTEVVHKLLAQWFFKITDYTDALLDELDRLDWPEPIKLMQRNWIGKSEGVTMKFQVKGMGIEFEMYDSVPQTFMAQTFTVIAPEHPQVYELVKGTEYEKSVMEFVERIRKKKIAGKFDVDKDIEGIFTGRYIDYTLGKRELPIWVASFVLHDYGTGIVNASAHDKRDFEFAKKYELPLHPVMFPADKDEAEKVKNLEYAHVKDPEGIIQEPTEFKGRKWGEAREDLIRYIVQKGVGKRDVNYKLRDWLISRQRYWGAPVPIIYCDKCGEQPVPEQDLPVKLPTDVDFRPTGESPLARSKEFHQVKCPKCDGAAKRDDDTMDTFVDSSWYYLRFTDSMNEQKFADKEELKKWTPVDTYVGGAEHAVLHLMYARFITKVLHDLKLVDFTEPFLQLRNQGLILAEDGSKMSKSKGNVINPDDLVEEFGADSLRMYEMFIGPLEDSAPWQTKGVIGVRRFLDKVFRHSETHPGPDPGSNPGQIPASAGMETNIHKLIKKVTEDIQAFKFNTSIAAFMEFLNENKSTNQKDWETYLVLLAPFAPHVTEELWEMLGHTDSIHKQPWPEYDRNLVKDNTVTIVIQVNGKVRANLEFPVGIDQKTVKEKALAQENVQKFMGDKQVVKEIFVKDRLINFVTK